MIHSWQFLQSNRKDNEEHMLKQSHNSLHLHVLLLFLLHLLDSDFFGGVSLEDDFGKEVDYQMMVLKKEEDNLNNYTQREWIKKVLNNRI